MQIIAIHNLRDNESRAEAQETSLARAKQMRARTTFMQTHTQNQALLFKHYMRTSTKNTHAHSYQTQTPETQLIAHEKEVARIEFFRDSKAYLK
jgi:hypothetical protein